MDLPKEFGLTQVKKYLSAEQAVSSFFYDLRKVFSNFVTIEDEIQKEKITYETEILTKNDPRAKTKEMENAKKNEINGLVDRDTLKTVAKEETSVDESVLSGRFVLFLIPMTV